MITRAVLRSLGWYRTYRSVRPNACRYDPTCSAYTHQAVALHGAGRGLYLGVRRVLRCHPLGGHGYDPVPNSHVPNPDAPAPDELRQHHV